MMGSSVIPKMRWLLVAAAVAACALLVLMPARAFAAMYEGTQDLGMFVGKSEVPKWSEDSRDEEHFRDPASASADFDVELGIYVGGVEGEDLSGSDGKTEDKYRDPAAADVGFSTDLGIWVGKPSDNPEDTENPNTVTGATGSTSVEANVDLGIWVGSDLHNDSGSLTQTVTGQPQVSTNTSLGIYVGENVATTKTEEADPSDFGTTVGADVELGIYVGQDTTKKEEADPSQFGTTIDNDVDLGIFVGGEVDVETGAEEAKPSTTLAIRVVNPAKEPDVGVEGMARVTWTVGSAEGAAWGDGTANVKNDTVDAPAGSEPMAATTRPGGNPTATYEEVEGWTVADTVDGSTSQTSADADLTGVKLFGEHSYTFTPIWKGKEYTVNLDAAGGTVTVNSAATTQLKFSYPNTLNLPGYPNVQRAATADTGYEFAGWYRADDGTGPVTSLTVADFANASTPIDLTAKWTERALIPPDKPDVGDYYTIKFTVNNGDPAMPDMYVKKGDLLDMSKVPLPAHPTQPQKYEAKGWFEDKECKTSVQSSYTIDANRTFYMYWRDTEQQSVTVKFDANGGTPESLPSYVVPVDGTLSDPGTTPSFTDMPKPTRAGYLLGGWFLEQKYEDTLVGGTRITPDTQITAAMGSPDVTVYAQWIAVTSVDVPLNVYLSINQQDADTFTVAAAKESQTQFSSRSPLPVQIADVKLTKRDGYEFTGGTADTSKKLTFDQREANAKQILGDGFSSTNLHVMTASQQVIDASASAGLLKVPTGTDSTVQDARGNDVAYELMTRVTNGKAVGLEDYWTIDVNGDVWNIFTVPLDIRSKPGDVSATPVVIQNHTSQITVPAATFAKEANGTLTTTPGTQRVFYAVSGFDTTELTYMGERLPVAAIVYTVQIDDGSSE